MYEFCCYFQSCVNRIFKLLQLPGLKIVFSLENWRLILAVGVFNFLAFSAFAYSSDVSKTPPQLQIILFGLEVPLTVFVRSFILKQGKVKSFQPNIFNFFSHKSKDNIVVSIFNVIVLLSTAISLTLCVNSITSAKSDEYTVLVMCTSFAVIFSLVLTGIFKLLQLPGLKIVFSLENWRLILAVGVFNFLAFSAFAYSSDVSKTPPQLQIILFGLEVPLTVFVRSFILKQGKVKSFQPNIFNFFSHKSKVQSFMYQRSLDP